MRRPRLVTLLAALFLALPPPLAAQDQRDEQFYYPGSFNWALLRTYPEAGRLFNAFDYGHAVLYERLFTRAGTRQEEALEKEYRYLTTNLLIRPPRFAVAEEAIQPAYAKLAWQAKQMFDWAHVLHRQIYDIYADERLTPEARDTLIERVTDYYLSRKEYAFTPVPKSMALMDEQSFSQGFRRAYPKFNGLIWAYHWLQVGLYEPLILGTTPAEKKAGVKATLARFWSMLEEAPRNFPMMMPMTAGVAPTFSARHPRAAVIFDNLHMMHDIISDILIADAIPRDRKRAVIYQQLAEFRDSSRNVISMEHWSHMAEMMGGVEMMGGPATGLLVPAHGGGEPRGHERMHPPGPEPAKPDTAAQAHPAPAPAAPPHQHQARPGAPIPPARAAPPSPQHEHGPASPARPVPGEGPADERVRPPLPGGPDRLDSAAAETPAHGDTTEASLPASGFPLHSGHPLVVHFPLVALLLAVVADAVAAARKSAGWRGAGTLLWWVGLAGAALAIGTGLLAYNRVEHSDLAHQAMIRHRNLALGSIAVLLGSAVWRWRKAFSFAAVAVGIIGALGLSAAGYLGGDLVYRHAIGIPTAVIERVQGERGSQRDSVRPAEVPHAHPPGETHEP